ncbi:Transcription factor FER-LIKE IRON DEFICIENCY-INDUCED TRANSCRIPTION FACTOR [Linum grandiflorum]
MDSFNETHQPFNHNNLELLDFIDDANFDQFIDLIRGGNEDDHAGASGGFHAGDDLINAFNHNFSGGGMPPLAGDYFAAGEGLVGSFENFAPLPPPEDLTAAYFGAAAGGGGGGEGCDDYYDDYWNVDGGEVSSGTTTTTGMTEAAAAGEPKRRKADRSKTLVSERRRRGSMKEKLYALRSLVPNITKMDKASIIGDAVSYVQDLQLRSKKLQSEIAGLEASLVANDGQQNHQFGGPNASKPRNPSTKKILMQMDVYQVEERGYFVRLVCNKAENAAVSLYKALESLVNFTVQSTNLTSSASDKFILTFNLLVRFINK